MSCDKNRSNYFKVLAASPEIQKAFGGLNEAQTAQALERLYQAGLSAGERNNSDADLLVATERTRRLFARMQALGIQPPTHSQDDLPRKAARFGYGRIEQFLDTIEKKQQEERRGKHRLLNLQRKFLERRGIQAESDADVERLFERCVIDAISLNEREKAFLSKCIAHYAPSSDAAQRLANNINLDALKSLEEIGFLQAAIYVATVDGVYGKQDAALANEIAKKLNYKELLYG